MIEPASKIWLVTGSAAGLGRDIAEAALKAGNMVVATARDPDRLADLADSHGDRVLPLALDVTDNAAAEAAVEATIERFGRIDVLVNNAGYGHLSPFEQMSAADFRDQIETNFFGVVNLSRAVLPAMRRQRSGHIIQISSVGGRMSTPGLSAYQAAKWAVGGFSESLAQEVASIGIKVCTLEPGGMRTNWAVRAQHSHPVEPLPEYKPAFDALKALLDPMIGNEAGDPVRVAQVVLAIADHPKPPLHLLLGSDALHYFGRVEAARIASDERWRAISRFTDFAGANTLPALPEE